MIMSKPILQIVYDIFKQKNEGLTNSDVLDAARKKGYNIGIRQVRSATTTLSLKGNSLRRSGGLGCASKSIFYLTGIPYRPKPKYSQFDINNVDKNPLICGKFGGEYNEKDLQNIYQRQQAQKSRQGKEGAGKHTDG